MQTDKNYIHKKDITWNDVPLNQYMIMWSVAGATTLALIVLFGYNSL